MVRLDKIVFEHLRQQALLDEAPSMPKKKHVKELISSGAVFVNNLPRLLSKEQIIPFVEFVTIKHHPMLPNIFIPIPFEESHGFFKMNKPKGYICQRHPTEKTVYDLIPSDLRKKFGDRLVTVGRLDRDTTGVLLFTTDGGIAQILCRPTTFIRTTSSSPPLPKWKKYIATLAEDTSQLDADSVTKLAEGITIRGTSKSCCNPSDEAEAATELTFPQIKCLPADLQIIDETKVSLSIQEGFFHQVKRMISFCGVEVQTLHRFNFGSLSLSEDAVPGEMVSLEVDEIANLVPANQTGYDKSFYKEIEERRKRCCVVHKKLKN